MYTLKSIPSPKKQNYFSLGECDRKCSDDLILFLSKSKLASWWLRNSPSPSLKAYYLSNKRRIPGKEKSAKRTDDK